MGHKGHAALHLSSPARSSQSFSGELVTRIGCHLQPLVCLVWIARHTLPALVSEPKVALRWYVSEICRDAEPVCSLFEVNWATLAISV
eukprot:6673379-Prymnesium_polylepis.1